MQPSERCHNPPVPSVGIVDALVNRDEGTPSCVTMLEGGEKSTNNVSFKDFEKLSS
jgi:hypothetical protein